MNTLRRWRAPRRRERNSRVRMARSRRMYVNALFVTVDPCTELLTYLFLNVILILCCLSLSLSWQYNFQHSELASKKEKLDRAEDKRKTDTNERHLTMSRNRDDLRKLREASREGASQCHVNKMTVASKLKKLDEICDIDGGKEFFMKLSADGLLSVVKDRKLEELNEIEQGNAALRRIIAGYQNALGSSNGGGAVSIMQQWFGITAVCYWGTLIYCTYSSLIFLCCKQ